MRLFLSWLFVFVIGCSGSYATEPMPASDAEHLVDVRFEGNKVLTDDEVRTVFGGTRVRRDFVERGILVLNAAYYDKGYLTTKVEVQGTPDAAVVRIVEGARFRISASEILERGPDGSRVEMLPAAAPIAAEVTRLAGGWFNRAAILDVLTRLRRAYEDAGFAAVELEPETALDPAHAQVRILVSIKRGPSADREKGTVTDAFTM